MYWFFIIASVHQLVALQNFKFIIIVNAAETSTIIYDTQNDKQNIGKK